MAFKGFILSTPWLHVEGMALFPLILIKRPQPTEALVNHERIHLRQQLELGVIPFYLLYLSEYAIRFLLYGNHYQAYFNLSFEREAFANQNNPDYLLTRKWFAFTRYFANKSNSEGSGQS